MKSDRNKNQEQKHRLTITLPHDDYKELEQRSSLQDVSIAWLVRKAVNQYISSDIQLLNSSKEEQ